MVRTMHSRHQQRGFTYFEFFWNKCNRYQFRRNSSAQVNIDLCQTLCLPALVATRFRLAQWVRNDLPEAAAGWGAGQPQAG